MLAIISIHGRKIIKEKTIASTAFVHFVLLEFQNLTVLSSFNTGGEFFWLFFGKENYIDISITP